MLPADVLDAQGDLLERAENSADFGDYVDEWARLEVESASNTDQRVSLAPTLARHTRAAYAYSITSEMSVLVEHAAADLEPLDRFDRALAPTGCGFVNFDKPLPVLDARGKKMLIHFLVWAPYAVKSTVDGEPIPCTALWCFNDIWREPDEIHQMFLEKARADYEPHVAERYLHIIGRWAPVGLSFAFQDQRMGPRLLEPSGRAAAEIVEDGLEPQAGTNILRYVHTLWLLLNQTLVRVEETPVDRPARRRAVRRGLPGKVSVIELRRREQAELETGESYVEWARSWIVRGHWAWRHCGRDKPGAVPYKGGWGIRVWINPYVKGDVSKPLVVPDKVYRLSR